ncbi:MAG: helicase HerA-like domain-containing protein [Adlercreutzia equolifaciens]
MPVRITISDMGPDLLARLLGLTDAARRAGHRLPHGSADDNGAAAHRS